MGDGQKDKKQLLGGGGAATQTMLPTGHNNGVSAAGPRPRVARFLSAFSSSSKQLRLFLLHHARQLNTKVAGGAAVARSGAGRGSVCGSAGSAGSVDVVGSEAAIFID